MTSVTHMVFSLVVVDISIVRFLRCVWVFGRRRFLSECFLCVVRVRFLVFSSLISVWPLSE